MFHKWVLRVFGNPKHIEDIIKHVEKKDEVGLKFMEMQLEFLKDLAKGNFIFDER